MRTENSLCQFCCSLKSLIDQIQALECNLEAVDAHIEALQKIVYALGGLENLSPWPLATIYA